MTFDEWWKKETDDNENNVDDWKGFCKTAFEAGQKEVKQLGERCNQLLKDKGNLTDELQELKETLAQTVENDEVAYETLKLYDQEEIGMLNSKVTELENKIADIKANCDLAIEGRDIKIMELEKDNRLLEQRGSDILKELLDKNKRCIELEQQIEKMKRHCNCKHRDSEGYCEVKRTYLMDLSYDGCDKWELED